MATETYWLRVVVDPEDPGLYVNTGHDFIHDHGDPEGPYVDEADLAMALERVILEELRQAGVTSVDLLLADSQVQTKVDRQRTWRDADGRRTRGVY